jgi:hypothetical protein
MLAQIVLCGLFNPPFGGFKKSKNIDGLSLPALLLVF